MKVVVVTGTVVPEQQRLWSACAGRGADITIVGTHFNSNAGRFPFPWTVGAAEGVPCVMLPIVTPARRRGLLWWWLCGLGRSLDDLRPDIVHVLSEPWAVPVQQTVLLRRHRPFRIVVHGCDNNYVFGNTPERTARSAVLRAVLPRIDGFLSWNAEGVDCARAAGLPSRTPVDVIPAVIPDERIFQPIVREEARRSLNGLSDRPVVGFIGRFDEEKGLRDLLACWGSGTLTSFLSDSFDRSASGRLFPALSLTDVPRAIAACDVVVVPSRTTPTWKEQFGRIALESMLVGTPVIAYPSGELPEVIGDSGVLVEEGDVDGLAPAIDRVLGDPAEATLPAASARDDAQRRFGAEPLSRRVLAFWERVLSL